MYWVYGLRLASNITFAHLPREPTLPGETPDLILEVQQATSSAQDSLGSTESRGTLWWRAGPPDYPSLSVYESDGATLFCYHRWVEFHVDAALHRVTCLVHPALDEKLIQYLFLGLVVSFVLHQRGCHNLHAAAVKVEDEAVAFIAPTGGGKSTLTAYFLSAGHALVSEDLLPLQLRNGGVWALAGPPQLRLWPDTVAKLRGNLKALPHDVLQTGKRQLWLPLSERFYSREPLPLRMIYFIERSQEQEARLTPLSQREIFLELVGSAFGNFLLDRKHLARQMVCFAQIVSTLTCRRLHVPSDFEVLPSIYEAVRKDLAAVKQQRRQG